MSSSENMCLEVYYTFMSVIFYFIECHRFIAVIDIESLL